MFLVCSWCGLCPIHWSQVLSWEWRCSWSSADRRCSNYIWVINNFIAYYGATYVRGFTVQEFPLLIGPGRFGNSFKSMIFKLLTSMQNSSLAASEIALGWMLQNLTNDMNEKSTLVPVMAWCRQATSHFLSQSQCPRKLLRLCRPEDTQKIFKLQVLQVNCMSQYQ